MGFFSDRGITRVERKVRVAKKKRTARDSMLEYLDTEIEKAINQRLELTYHPYKSDPSKKVKEIRMWGDIVDGKRRLTLKSMNKRLYESESHAKDGLDYAFENTDVDGVVREMKKMRDDIANSDEGSMKFYYRKGKKSDLEIIELVV